jgi:hypothetical protein
LTRTTLELKCTNCGTVFKKTFEERGRSTFYGDGEMVKLENACPNKCKNQWFTIQKQHSIRKFKKRY